MIDTFGSESTSDGQGSSLWGHAISFDTGLLRTAILEARQRIYGVLRLDEIELIGEVFSAIGGNFERVVIVADAEFSVAGSALCARETEWLRRKGYPSRAVRADVEPSFVFVDDQLFVSQLPVRMLPVADLTMVSLYQQAFNDITRLASVELPSYCPADDPYFEEYLWFPVPLTVASRYEPRIHRYRNNPAQILLRLHDAVRRRAPDRVCLRYWSRFIRSRDGDRCVSCGGTKNLAAHHVCRKALLPEGRFMTGNGMTLCADCHAHAHHGFNGRPDLSQPMDAQGGEKIELLAELFSDLAPLSRKGHPDDYFLSEQVLAKFKMLQGYDWYHPFAGTAVEQAATIWRGSPVNVIAAIIRANVPEMIR